MDQGGFSGPGRAAQCGAFAMVQQSFYSIEFSQVLLGQQAFAPFIGVGKGMVLPAKKISHGRLFYDMGLLHDYLPLYAFWMGSVGLAGFISGPYQMRSRFQGINQMWRR